MNTCSECSYANQAPLDPSNIGQERPIICRRYPPVAYPVPAGGGRIMTICVSPTVGPNETCGEFSSGFVGSRYHE